MTNKNTRNIILCLCFLLTALFACQMPVQVHEPLATEAPPSTSIQIEPAAKEALAAKGITDITLEFIPDKPKDGFMIQWLGRNWQEAFNPMGIVRSADESSTHIRSFVTDSYENPLLAFNYHSIDLNMPNAFVGPYYLEKPDCQPVVEVSLDGVKLAKINMLSTFNQVVYRFTYDFKMAWRAPHRYYAKGENDKIVLTGQAPFKIEVNTDPVYCNQAQPEFVRNFSKKHHLVHEVYSYALRPEESDSALREIRMIDYQHRFYLYCPEEWLTAAKKMYRELVVPWKS
jgi:hypothetical protein